MKKIIFITIVMAFAWLFMAMRVPSSGSWNETDHAKYLHFSHKFHVKDQGVACEDCHHDAKASKQSSDNIIGDHESCKACHEEQLSNTCNYCHVDPENITPIPAAERELRFSHELHATTNGIKCETCHAGLSDVTYATAANMPTMTVCMNCHKKQSAPTECGTCHTNFAGLIPKDHLNGDFKKVHKEMTRLGELSVSCATCHTESFCQNCHSGIELKGFGTYKDLMADPSPRMSLRVTPRETKLQNVHNLNYKYTHGVDARSNATDCYACHEQQTFCVECHQAGNLIEGKIRPKNHDLLGFKTFGKGSGGGRHAELAERNIEYCMSCHDVEGKDPVCMICHTENGGVR